MVQLFLLQRVVYGCSTTEAAVKYENLSLISRAEWYHRSHPCDGSRKTVDEERAGGQVTTERRDTGRACNINPFNKLIIDEIYRAFTVRGGGANALHLSRGNPGYISGLAPLRLDLRARANEPRPASATKEVVQNDAAALGRYGYDAARGSWASLKIYPSEWRRRESKEE